MQPRMYSAATTVVLATTVLFILFSSIGRVDSASSVTPANAPDALTIIQVDPSSAPNDLDTTIIISGTGFTAELSDTIVITPPRVFLGAVELNTVGWLTITTLTATVPWGMNPGIYTITVTNPNGEVGLLTSAFTVTQSIGVWTTGGPYGGMVSDLAVSPVISRTTFAVVDQAGLFRTQDGGDNWSAIIYDAYLAGVSYGPAPTNTLYAWGSTGLWRSHDVGTVFEQVISEQVRAFAVDLQDDRHLWYANNYAVYRSANGGVSWEYRSTGLPSDSTPVFIVINSGDSSIVYVGFLDGRMFKTIDTGLNWVPISTGIPASTYGYALAINPYAPDNLFYYRYVFGGSPAYRSSDGGETWCEINIDPSQPSITDLAFSPYISGTVYASINGGYLTAVSLDSGETWLLVGERGLDDFPISIGLDPTNGLPIYLGGIGSGIKRSLDGGQTWEFACNGLAGLRVLDIAAVSGQPETVYVAGHGAGGFASDNAGNSWRKMDLPYPFATAVVIDPQSPDWIYVTSGLAVFYSQDSGVDWESIYVPNWSDAWIETLAINPTSPSMMFAGGYDNPSWGLMGVAYRSKDYGETWTPLTFTQPISAVSNIVVDPVMSNTIYVSTGRRTSDYSPGLGKGVFRSRDGGETWQRITQGMGDVPAYAMAIHPDQPQVIYASAWLTSEGRMTVFKSTNGGDSWTPTSLRAWPGWYWSTPLVIDPLAPDTLYAGAADGLFRSTNGGMTWTRAAGPLGSMPIFSLAAAASEDRTIVYVGVIGGTSAGGQTRLIDTGYVQGGVYKQTIDHRPHISIAYLPLVTKSAEQYAPDSLSMNGWDNASVIDPVVITDNGVYKMWFTGVGQDGISRIGYATSTDGSHWAKYAGNPVLDIGAGTDWDTGGVRVNAVIKEETAYKLWYEGGGYQHLGLATSADGIHWTKYAGNPIFDIGPTASWDEGLASFSAVITDSGTYKMWYSGAGASSFGGPIRIGYATSSNGITWTKFISNPVLDMGPSPWDAAWTVDPSVIVEGGTYKMWYSGLDAFPFFNHTLRIGVATSADGISWTKSISNPALTVEPASWDKQTATAPSVIFDGSTYHMWYHGGTLGGLETIGYATSLAGISWTKYPGNPVLIPTQLVYLPVVTRSN